MGTWLQLPSKVYRHARKERKQGIQPSSSTWLGNAAVTQSRQSRVGSRRPSAEGNSGYDSRSRDMLRGEVLVRHVRTWGLLLGTSKTEGGSRTRLELRKALCPRCPEKGPATASQQEGEKVIKGEAHHWSRPGGIASRLVLSSDGDLGPEARVTWLWRRCQWMGARDTQSGSRYRGASITPAGYQGSSGSGLHFRDLEGARLC